MKYKYKKQRFLERFGLFWRGVIDIYPDFGIIEI